MDETSIHPDSTSIHPDSIADANETPDDLGTGFKDPSAAKAAAPSTPAKPDFLKGALVTYRGEKGVITLSFDDDTADVQLVDDNGDPKLDANNQPMWFGRVPTSELSPR
jgi:hypothetical protein